MLAGEIKEQNLPAHADVGAAVGNYAVGVRNKAASEEYAISTAMLGNPSKGVRLLRSISDRTPRAQFFLAAAEWLLGRDADAVADLNHVNLSTSSWGTAASELSHLINGTRTVLLVNPSLDLNWVNDTLAGLDGHLHVVRLGPKREPLLSNGQPLTLTDIDCSRTIALNLGLHSVNPASIKSWGVPCVGWTQDADINLGQITSFANEYDALICFTGGEHDILSKLTNTPLYTYIGFEPYFIGYSASAEEAASLRYAASSLDRPIDVAFAGDPFHWAYYDKHARLSNVLRSGKDLNIAIIRRSLGHEQYFNLLRRSSLTPTSTRFEASISNRMFDALYNGTLPLYFNESIVPDILDEFSEFSFQLEDDFSCLDMKYIIEACKIKRKRLIANYSELAEHLSDWRPSRRLQASRFLRYCFLTTILSRNNLPASVEGRQGHRFRLAVDRHNVENFGGSLIEYVDAITSNTLEPRTPTDRLVGLLSVWGRQITHGVNKDATEGAIDDLLAKYPALAESLLGHFAVLYRYVNEKKLDPTLSCVSSIRARLPLVPEEVVAVLEVLPDIPVLLGGYSIARVRQIVLTKQDFEVAFHFTDGLLSLISALSLVNAGDPLRAAPRIENALLRLPIVSTLSALAISIYQAKLTQAPDISAAKRLECLLLDLRQNNVAAFCEALKSSSIMFQVENLVEDAIDAMMGIEDWYFDHSWALFLGAHFDKLLSVLHRRGLIARPVLSCLENSEALSERPAARKLVIIGLIGLAEVAGSRREDITMIGQVGRRIAVGESELYPLLYSLARFDPP
ncbi:hypothetical protein [Methylobacterium segetis]|uniref:hypothetical protein n=1 Tax=Methylobacterium segetis TaxID=2488750 RepID=UPI00104C53B8|nr:hypothetical protein [Methylobacterium segetis]